MGLCFAPAVLVFCTQLAAHNPQAPQPLGEMRQALGGEAALSGVESFMATGKVTRVSDAGPASAQLVEIVCHLPDKFLRTVTHIGPIRAPNGSSRLGPRGSTFEGFNLDLPIRGSRDASGRRNAVFMSSGAPSPDELDRRLTLVVRRLHQDFARLALALFGTSFGAYPMELHHRDREARGEQQADVIEAVAPDGFTARLLVDASTHLPLAVSWKAVPSVVITAGSASIRGVPEPVEHTMFFSDFRVGDGLKWPYLIKEYAGSRLVQETRLETFVINPKLHPETFSGAR
jgi:hypothetical protein